ncbi:transmembrane protein 214 [Diorhabda sublineata]|uniref:transmembrane protein 214 n=1 Tax=Diorhabda sublineata TaxID=1163346 RepID=UPI0024E111B6|nr:transmembrane protein 214 [Diorhabda sublineata]
MSGQWEVVTKKRDKGSKLPIPKVNNSKDFKNNKNVLNGVKIEEVLPKSQVQNLYSSKLKENKLLDKNKPKENVKKAVVKKEKQVEHTKPKPPKSIESALNAIDVNEFKDVYEKNKNHFPEAPIVWLKELLQYLNQKVPIESHDPVFSTKPINYPLSVVPSGLNAIIQKVLKEAGKSNIQLFFDICLTSLATEMSKGLPATGYKIFLQYISLQEPTLVMTSIQKHVNLRNSYQNRPNIGLSILWGISHVGYKNFSSGLLVFQDLFLPLLEMKHYSRYVLTYLINLLKINKEKPLSLDELLLILNVVYNNKKNMPNDLIQELTAIVSDIKPSSIKQSGNIDILLKNINLNSNALYQTYLCDILVETFYNDQSTLSTWGKIYSKNIQSSAILLEYMSNNWSKIYKKINRNAFNSLITNIKSINEELSLKKRKEEGVKSSIAAIQKIEKKMVVKEKKGSSSKLLIILLLTIGGLLYYDIKQHGSWNESLTNKTLKEYKVCEYSHLVIDKLKEGLHWTSEKIEEHFPNLQQTIITYSEPYVELAINLGKLCRNAYYDIKERVLEKYPVVVESVEVYLPGIIENSQKMLSNAYVTSILYYNRGMDYLKNEVFVGQLSPENMQRVVIEAFNSTQQKATEYYHWIYEKVQTSIK